MSIVASAPPVRQGVAKLRLLINEDEYALSPVRGPRLPSGYSRGWRLRKLSGERAGSVHVCLRCPRGHGLECSCPDASYNNHAGCKHLRALVAAGLLSARRPRPSESASAPVKGGGS